MTNYINRIFLASLFMTIALAGFSQVKQRKMNCDSLIWVTEKQFDSIVAQSLTLLNTKKLSEISIEQHQAILRAFNRIWMSQLTTPKYAKGIYAELKRKLDGPWYSTEILKIFPGWTPNKGMGMYFHKLNIEYGGSPCSWSVFSIKH